MSQHGECGFIGIYNRVPPLSVMVVRVVIFASPGKMLGISLYIIHGGFGGRQWVYHGVGGFAQVAMLVLGQFLSLEWCQNTAAMLLLLSCVVTINILCACTYN